MLEVRGQDAEGRGVPGSGLIRGFWANAPDLWVGLCRGAPYSAIHGLGAGLLGAIGAGSGEDAS